MPGKKTTTKTTPEPEKEEKKETSSTKNHEEENLPVLTPRVYAPEPIMPDVNQLMKLGDALAKSGMFPDVKTPAAAIAKIEAGRELGIKPVMALNSLYVVSGRLAIMGAALAALAKASGINIEIVKKDTKGCTLRFSRPGQSAMETSFTEEDAKRADLLKGVNYQKYPEEMYYNRCISKGIKVYDPAITLGMYTVEELRDIGPEEDFSKPGKIIDARPEKTEPESSPATEEEPPEGAGVKDEERAAAMAKQKEEIIEIIKKQIEKEKIHEPDFKDFLQLQQTNNVEYESVAKLKEIRCFVSLNEFNKWSFHCGKFEDLKILKENMDWTIKQYRKYQEEIKKEKESEEAPM